MLLVDNVDSALHDKVVTYSKFIKGCLMSVVDGCRDMGVVAIMVSTPKLIVASYNDQMQAVSDTNQVISSDHGVIDLP